MNLTHRFKTFGLTGTVVLSLAVSVTAQQRPDPVAEDPPTGDVQYATANRTVAIASGGVRMNGVLFVAQGAGPHRNVILLHGFPGNERNLDLAQAMRRAGWNVLTFQYRGAWGSEGSFSFTGVVDDVSAAIAFLRGPEGVAGRGDPGQIVLVGHSMGGWAALMSATRDPNVRAVASIAGWNIGRASRELVDAEKYTAAVKATETSVRPLRGTTPDALVRERAAHVEDWDLTKYAPQLATKSVLLIGGQRDSQAPMPENHIPLVTALEGQGAPNLKIVVLDADHAFSDKRVALTRAVLSWLETLKGR
jgi:pimeloyl-ACP methyl ester carboxylesterase